MNRFRLASSVAVLTAVLSGAALYGFDPDPDPDPSPAPEEKAARILLGAMGSDSGSYLGVGVAEITADRAKQLNLREERGVEITRVEENSPADKGGLKTGDVVLEYNGQRVEGLEQFMRMVRETPPGREVKLALSRNGGAQQAIVKTGSRKMMAAGPRIEAFEWPQVRMPDVPRANMSWRSATLGIEGESLEAQLAQFFGVKEGVLVRSVIKGSAAEKAGLRAGDVITKVDETSVTSPREITSAMRASRNKRTVTIGAVREKRDMTFTVNVEDSPAELRMQGRSAVAH